jgi:putative ABC transport system substrate-binding protein
LRFLEIALLFLRNRALQDEKITGSSHASFVRWHLNTAERVSFDDVAMAILTMIKRHSLMIESEGTPMKTTNMSRKILALCCALSLLLAGASMAVAETEIPYVGIIQYATHPSLDNCYTGFMAALAEAGYVDGETITIELQNSMADMSNSDLQAKTMAAKDADMLVGIATPSAMSAYAVTKEAGTPVIFIAVSDAVAAGIVQSNEATGTNCTGVSDVLNIPAQLKMIRAFLPEAKTIGVVYTTSEPNSIVQLEVLTAAAPEYGFEIEAVGITNGAEIAAAAATLIAKGVDCFNNFTDNLVVENISLLLHATDEAGIPVFGSEETQVASGCLATEGLDYVALGHRAGEMAVAILKGEATPQTIPVATDSDTTPVYNSAVAARLGLALPEGYEGATVMAAVAE